ncbi:MAG: hypothetical protein HYZ89_05410 [Candidatus Omnitrophica bacterium]|nr:hypothetical protein [Candidatus Omnitrophota bacterium]
MPAQLERIPLWETKWPQEALTSKRRAIGERAFNRGFRQMALSDEERTFRSFDRCLIQGAKPSELAGPDAPRFMGVDPFGQHVVIFVLALKKEPIPKRVPVAIYRGSWGPAETVRHILEAYRQHLPQGVKVENVAAQEAIVQWCKEKGEVIPIEGFMTGKQKADPEIGLPSLEVEFENGSWEIGYEEHEYGCPCAWCVWIAEMRGHPLHPTQDAVMACWFAREASRGTPLVIDAEGEEEPVDLREVYRPERSSPYAPERRSIRWQNPLG